MNKDLSTIVKVSIDVQADVDTAKNKIINAYNDCKNALDDAINNPASRSLELFNELSNKIAHMSNDAFKLEGLIPDNHFFGMMELISKLDEQLKNLKDIPPAKITEEEHLNALNSTLDNLRNINFQPMSPEQLSIQEEYNKQLEKQLEAHNEINNLTSGNKKQLSFQQMINQTLINAPMEKDWFDELIEGANNFEDISDSADVASDSVQKFNFNVEDLVGALADISSTGKISASTVASLAKSFGATNIQADLLVIAFNLIKKAIDEIIDTCKECQEDVTNLLKSLGAGAIDGIELTVDGLKELSDVLEEAINKMQEFSDLGVEAQQGYFTLYNYLGDASNEIVNFTNALQEAYGLNASGLINNMRGVLGMVSNMRLEAEQATDTIKAFAMFGQDLSAFSGYSFAEVTGQLEAAINLGTLRSTSPIVRALDLTKEDIELFRELNTTQERANFILSKGEKIRGTYENWLKTSAGKVQSLTNSTENLENSLGKLATGLYAKVAPALTAIVNLITKCVDGIAELVNIDLSDIAKDSNTTVKSYEDIAGALDDVGDSADKATGKTRKFDDLILVDKGTNTDGFNSEDFDVSSWLTDINKEKTELEIILEEFYRLISDKKYREAGKYLADSINNLLSDINWSDIKERFHAGGAIIASVLSGIFGNKDIFSSIGGMFANGLNAGISGIAGFLFGDLDNPNGFDFGGFGESLGASWKAYWETFDSSELGRVLEGVFSGVVDFVNGWLTGGGLVNITSNIGNIISNFFMHFSEEDVEDTANAVVGLLDNAFDAVQNLLDKINGDTKIKDSIKNLINKAIEKVKNNSGDWGSTLNELITSILDFASELLLENKDNITEAVGNFLNELDIETILSDWLELKWTDFVLKIGSLIDGLAVDVINFLSNPLGNISDFIGDAFSSMGSKAGSKFLEFLGGSIGVLGNLTSMGLGRNAWSGLNNILGNFGIKLPWMATGGIAYRATPVVIGDGGMEAVLPLTQNTGWAKQVADLININLPNNKNNSGGTVVVDMSGFNKQFYTRSELLDFGEQIVEALKLQGLNVASLV